MTQLSAPTPSPSVPKRSSGRYIDFVARPKTSLKTTPKFSQRITSKTTPKLSQRITPKTTPNITLKTTPKTEFKTKIETIQTAPKIVQAPKPEPTPAEPTPVKAIPRQRRVMPKGLRMDFVRRPKDAPLPEVKVKKTVQISIASSSAGTMPEMSTPHRSVPSVETMPEMSAPHDDDLSLALAGFADDDDEEMPSLTDDRSREANDFEDELKALDELDDIDKISEDLEAEIADFVDDPKPIFEKSEKTAKAKKLDAPDANRFSLGGRSPFLTSVKVEKRPLSGAIPDEDIKSIKKEVKTPLKNAYRTKIKQVLKSDDDKKLIHRETTIVSTPEPHAHNIGLAIAILLTIILGGLIGAVVYLIFFQ